MENCLDNLSHVSPQISCEWTVDLEARICTPLEYNKMSSSPWSSGYFLTKALRVPNYKNEVNN